MLIEVPGTPISLARPRFYRNICYDSQKKEKQIFQILLQKSFKESPISYCFKLSCTFVFPMPESWSNAKRKASDGKWKESRPDLDNLCKWVLDTGNKILWTDDALAVRFVDLQKIWGIVGKTIIKFEDIDEKQGFERA